MANALPPLHSIPGTFHQFQRLPLELRNDIWSLVIRSSSQILEFNFQICSPQLPSGPTADDVIHISSPARSIPAVLHTCQESRHMAVAEYVEGYALAGNQALEPPRGTPCRVLTRLAERNARLYWNPSRDIITLRPGGTRLSMCGDVSTCRTAPAETRPVFDGRTRYLALDHESYTQGDEGWGSRVCLMLWIDMMTDLELVIIRISGREWSQILAQVDGREAGRTGEVLQTEKKESILKFKESVLEQWEFLIAGAILFSEAGPRPKLVQIMLAEDDEEMFKVLNSVIYP